MKIGSTLFLKIALFIMGIPVVVLGGVGIVYLINNPANAQYAHILYPIVIALYLSVIPYLVALYQSFRLLTLIDYNNAFSQMSVNALKVIKFCALTFSGIYVIVIPFVYFLAQIEDAPGLIIMGMVPIFASLVISVFAAVLQRLLQEAINIKSENDLTV
ncbi:DUF2975 domain-containing protein [Ureibacillus sp. MALMAid1270]|uniref:DUF2975 domain-containing protein n=1 Tax=Ureibacillus sp. MALMAid1270 TaxID=3411629 RepID=UPI003BA4AB7E